MIEQNDFLIKGYLNKQKTLFFGLAYDEAIPAMVIVFLSFAFSITPMIGIIFGYLWIQMLKIAKKGNGSNFLLTILYWYMPYSIQKLIFNNTPSSDYKFWIY